jgi:hypothetical protein
MNNLSSLRQAVLGSKKRKLSASLFKPTPSEDLEEGEIEDDVSMQIPEPLSKRVKQETTKDKEGDSEMRKENGLDPRAPVLSSSTIQELKQVEVVQVNDREENDALGESLRFHFILCEEKWQNLWKLNCIVFSPFFSRSLYLATCHVLEQELEACRVLIIDLMDAGVPHETLIKVVLESGMAPSQLNTLIPSLMNQSTTPPEALNFVQTDVLEPATSTPSRMAPASSPTSRRRSLSNSKSPLTQPLEILPPIPSPSEPVLSPVRISKPLETTSLVTQSGLDSLKNPEPDNDETIDMEVDSPVFQPVPLEIPPKRLEPVNIPGLNGYKSPVRSSLDATLLSPPEHKGNQLPSEQPTSLKAPQTLEATEGE